MPLFLTERNVSSRILSLFTGLLLSTGALAENYQDPLDLPAIKMASSQHALLLDGDVAGTRLLAVGERGHIIYSDNNGTQWQQADVPSRGHLNAVQFIDENQGWSVGEDGIVLNTQNGGITWQKQMDIRDAEQKGPLLDVYFLNANEGFAVGVFNKIYHTIDGGNSWQAWQDNIDNLDEWHLFAIAAAGDHLYIASEMGLVFRSLDGGQSFTQIQTDHDGSFHGILARKGVEGHDELVLFGVGGVVYTSIDSGENWQYVDTSIEDGLSGGIWLENNSALLVGANGVMVTVDASLMQASSAYTDNGYPLNSVFSYSAQSHIALGLGGVHKLNSPKLAK